MQRKGNHPWVRGVIKTGLKSTLKKHPVGPLKQNESHKISFSTCKPQNYPKESHHERKEKTEIKKIVLC